MRKEFKKAVALVSAFALVVAGVTYSPKTSKADIIDGTAWQSWTSAGGEFSSSTTAGYTLNNSSVGTTWWNIQTWVPDVNIVSGYTYTASFKLTSSVPKYFTVDARVGDYQYFAQPTMDKWVDNGNGTYTYNYTSTYAATTSFKYDFRIALGYNDKNNEQVDNVAQNTAITVTVSDFSLTRVETEGETQGTEVTTAPEETLPDGFTAVAGTGKDGSVAPLGVYGELYQGGSWANAHLAYKGAGADTGDLTLRILSSNGAAGGWGIQVKYPKAGLDASKEYTMAFKYNASKAGTMFVKIEGVNEGETSSAVAGDNTYTKDFTGKTNVVVVLELSGFGADTDIDIEYITFTEKSSGEVETTAPQQEETTAPQQEETTPASGYTWVDLGNGIGEGGNNFSYRNDTDCDGVVNVQQPGWATEPGVYVQVGFAPTSVTVNGATSNSSVDGAGVCVFLSELTQNINTVVFTNGAMTHTLIIKNGNVPAEAEITTSPDVKVSGLQMNVDTSGVSKNSPSFRVILKAPTTFDTNTVENYGTLYALASEYAGDDNGFVKGNADVKDHTVTATAMWTKSGDANQYFTLTFTNNGITAAAMSAEYMIRPYAVLSNGTVVYGEIKTVSPFAIAKTLYDGKKMLTKADHEFLYNNVLNVVTVANNKLAIATAAKDVSDAATGNAVYKALGVYNRTYPRTSGPDLSSYGSAVVTAAQAYYYPVVAY